MVVQFRILSGKQAGTRWAARRFPVRLGRAPDADLRLEEDGIWDDHLRIEFNPREGYLLQPGPGALAHVNGHPVQSGMRVRNGDIIELGASRIQFWLGEPRQRGLRFRESLTWILIGLVCLTQVALIYWLLKE